MAEEIAPGVMVSDLGVPGNVYIIDAAAFGITELGEGGKLVVIHYDDWNRLPKADREQLADELTRDSAERGQRRLEHWLKLEG